MKLIKILIVDDQTLMREGLKTILDLEDDMEVIGTADNGKQAYEMVEKYLPDVVVMDIKMPVMDGIECTGLIKKDFPDTNILILTTFSRDDFIVEGLANGASGFLLKDINGDNLVSYIRDAARGDIMLPSSIATKLAARISSLSPHVKNSMYAERLKQQGIEFSERERQIVQLMLEGLSNRQIAQSLFISEGTVKNYVSIIYSKIGINERTKAVMYLKDLKMDF